jgi:hypothetical protein
MVHCPAPVLENGGKNMNSDAAKGKTLCNKL